MDPCAIVAAERQHQRRLSSGDKRFDAIEREIAALIADQDGEYYPFSVGAVAAAISDITQSDIEQLAAHLSSPGGPNICLTGGTIMRIATCHARERAQKEAERIVDNSCLVCFGEGCPACDES